MLSKRLAGRSSSKGHDTGGIYESYGRGWLIQIPDEKENILKEGDWNTMRIKVQGDNVQNLVERSRDGQHQR